MLDEPATRNTGESDEIVMRARKRYLKKLKKEFGEVDGQIHRVTKK